MIRVNATINRAIRRWDKEGKIKAIRIIGGYRRFNLNQVKAMLDNEKLKDKKVTVIYARVSTPNRKDDLNRQRTFKKNRKHN